MNLWWADLPRFLRRYRRGRQAGLPVGKSLRSGWRFLRAYRRGGGNNPTPGFR